MKNNNIIPIVCGAISLLVCIGIVANWQDIINAIATAENVITKTFASICIASPFIAFICCVYFILKKK